MGKDEKLIGLLHDSLDKALCIIVKQSHLIRAKDIAKNIVTNIPQRILNEIQNHHRPQALIGFADKNASAANRGLIPCGSSVPEITLQNPFSGYLIRSRRLRYVSSLQSVSAFSQITSYNNPKMLNDVFWKLIYAYYQAYLGQNDAVSQYLFLLPEDTRIPSSPIISHLLMTSALAQCVESFWLVNVHIGGVQDFISNARKTRDLWAGSYIYSLLSLSVIEYFINNYGPASVMIPWILDIPLVGAKIFGETYDNDVLLPLLPNMVTSIICPEEGRNVEKEIKECLRNTWKKIVNAYIKYLKREISQQIDENLTREALKFERIFPKIRIIILDYQKASNSKIRTVLDEIAHYSEIKRIPSGGCTTSYLEYPHQPLENFETYMKILQIGMRYKKNAIKFEGEPEIFEKGQRNCMMCGVFKQAIFSLNSQVNEQIWKTLEKKYIVDYGERLCHLCLLKRTLTYFVHDIIGYNITLPSIPSTSDIGATWFKISLLALFLSILNSGNEKIIEKAEQLLQKIAENIRNIAKIVQEEKRLRCKEESLLEPIRRLYKRIKESKTTEKRAKVTSNKTVDEYLERFGIKIIICTPGEFFDAEDVRIKISRVIEEEKAKELVIKGVEQIRELQKNLDSWSDFIKGKSEIIESAQRIVADVIIEILAGSNEKIADAYRNILNKIFKVFGSPTDDFSKIIPIALKPQGSLRFCVLRADADFMGDWINGDKCFSWILMHHPYIIPEVQKLNNIKDEILSRPRPISPSYLSTFSMTLGFNALLISKIISAFGGFLIYTGGDDILALVPPEVWHLVYLLLRFTFSSEIILNNALKRYKHGIYSYGMGWRASQSYGVVIAHHKACLLYTSPSPRDLSTSRMPSSA